MGKYYPLKIATVIIFSSEEKSFHKIIVLIIQYEIEATNCKCVFTQPCMNLKYKKSFE